jgi:outer membrane protein assembly factor BamB
MLALGIGFGLGFLLLGGVWAFNNLDLERRQEDPNRLAKLANREIGTSVSQVVSHDWPQWRGANRDGLSLETDLCKTWPAQGPRELWRKSIGRGFSSTVVAGERVYTMDESASPADAANQESVSQAPQVDDSSQAASKPEEGVVCLDAGTGRQIWRFRSPNSYLERFGSGPRSTPTVSENRVYAVGPTGLLYCLSADTGELIWQHHLLVEFNGRPMRYGVAFSPLVEGDLVVTTPGGPEGNAVVAFNKRTGEVVWKALDDPMGYSSPIAATLAGIRQILIFSNTELVSLAPEDGQVYWRYPWETTGGFNIATPITFGDCVFISSGYGKGCALLEVTRVPAGSLEVNRVYEHNRMRNHFATSVRFADHLYGFDQTDLVCMDLRTGKMIWRQKGYRDFGKGSLMIAGNQLIVLGESGKLFLADATSAGYSEKSSYHVSPNKCWTAPIVAQGKMYIRTESQIICLDLRQHSMFTASPPKDGLERSGK